MNAPVRNYSKLADDILSLVGGEENISNLARCATRLRLVLKKPLNDIKKEEISKLTGVITVIDKGGQLQIVIGTHVDKVFDAMNQLVNINETETSEVKTSILNRVIATMSAVFAPFVYILAAAGILQGCLIIIHMFAPDFNQTGAGILFNMISWTPFAFLPIFIAVTASKHFKCNMFIAMACCAALINSDFVNNIVSVVKSGQSIDFFGISFSDTVYGSSVLPPLFLVWILSYLERFFNKIINDVIKPLFVPLLCMIIMVPLTILLIGPLSSGAAHWIAQGYNYLVELSPSFAGAIIGGVWQVFVIFGVHWGITPVVMANFEVMQRDSFQAFQTIAVIAQIGAVFGFFLRTKIKELKGVSLSAFVTGLFGITEPAIYGVTLRFKRPFIYGCLCGAIGGIIAGLFQPYYYAYAALPGPLTIINAYNPGNIDSIIGEVIGCCIAFIGPIILLFLFGTGESKSTLKIVNDAPNVKQPPVEASVATEPLSIASPMIGELQSLSEVPDPVFAAEMMGKGVAIIPTENKVFAPFDCEVTVLFEKSKHAIGLISIDGVELLIHVGIDTVRLEQPFFQYHVKLNQKVKQGDLLMSFDINGILESGCPIITPIIITNSGDYENIESAKDSLVNTQSIIFNIK